MVIHVYYNNRNSYCDTADGKGADVGERGDGDGDAGVAHRVADPLAEVVRRARLLLVVEALQDDEHVVDPDP